MASSEQRPGQKTASRGPGPRAYLHRRQATAAQQIQELTGAEGRHEERASSRSGQTTSCCFELLAWGTRTRQQSCKVSLSFLFSPLLWLSYTVMALWLFHPVLFRLRGQLPTEYVSVSLSFSAPKSGRLPVSSRVCPPMVNNRGGSLPDPSLFSDSQVHFFLCDFTRV